MKPKMDETRSMLTLALLLLAGTGTRAGLPLERARLKHVDARNREEAELLRQELGESGSPVPALRAAGGM